MKINRPAGKNRSRLALAFLLFISVFLFFCSSNTNVLYAQDYSLTEIQCVWTDVDRIVVVGDLRGDRASKYINRKKQGFGRLGRSKPGGSLSSELGFTQYLSQVIEKGKNNKTEEMKLFGGKIWAVDTGISDFYLRRGGFVGALIYEKGKFFPYFESK